MTLVFAKERSEESLKEAMFAGRTATLFFNKLVGRKELIEPIVKRSVSVAPSHFYQDDYLYFTVRNISDIEFTFIRKGNDQSELPGKFILPARGSIVLRAKQEKGQTMTYTYNLENVLTGVGQYYEYGLQVQ
jgi:hypothetical protein